MTKKCPECGAKGARRHEFDYYKTAIGVPNPPNCTVWECGSRQCDGDMFIQGASCRIVELEIQVATLQAQYKELCAAVWACPVNELQASHEETIKEAEKDVMLAAECKEAKQYAIHLFSLVAPQCTPLPTLAGIISQLDNYIAGTIGKVKKHR